MIPAFQKNTVEPPRATDVILGRGRQPVAHQGNVALNKIVEQYAPRYHSSTSRKAKKQITVEIVKAAKEKGARFLRRKSLTNAWEEVDMETMRVRVGQSIRYIHKMQQQERNLFRDTTSSFSEDQQRNHGSTDITSVMNSSQQARLRPVMNRSEEDAIMRDDMMFGGLSEEMRCTGTNLAHLEMEYDLDPLEFSEEFTLLPSHHHHEHHHHQPHRASCNNLASMEEGGYDDDAFLAEQASTQPSMLDFRRSI